MLFFFLFVSTASAAVELWGPFQILGVLAANLQALVSAFSGIVVAHCIFCIDTTEMFFRVLNSQIRSLDVSMHSPKKIEILKYVKLIHMDLWILVQQINTFFSWSLFFYTINYSIYVVYDLYYVFHIMQAEPNNISGVSGTFYFCCCWGLQGIGSGSIYCSVDSFEIFNFVNVVQNYRKFFGSSICILSISIYCSICIYLFCKTTWGVINKLINYILLCNTFRVAMK